MIQVIGVTLVGAIIIVYLKSVNSELTVPTLVCVSVFILSFSLRYLADTVNFFNELKNITGLNENLVIIIVKITAIGYLIEFAAGTVEDMGLKSLSDKLVFVGYQRL